MAAISSPTSPALDPGTLKDLIVASLDADQAEDITVIDLDGRSTMADWLVIASGASARQVGAMAADLHHKVKAAGGIAAEPEGMASCDWVLIDAGDVVVHLFRPEVRAFYGIEELWGLETPHRPLLRVV